MCRTEWVKVLQEFCLAKERPLVVTVGNVLAYATDPNFKDPTNSQLKPALAALQALRKCQEVTLKLPKLDLHDAGMIQALVKSREREFGRKRSRYDNAAYR